MNKFISEVDTFMNEEAIIITPTANTDKAEHNKK